MIRLHAIYGLILTAVIALGLASRTKAAQSNLPSFVSEYAGDTLWALAAFFGLRFLFPKLPTWHIAAFAFGFALLIELSQLYQADWLNALRHTRLGGLILGFGFLWSDLLCYAVGVACGAALDWLIRPRKP